jgi:hypothetical protein
MLETAAGSLARHWCLPEGSPGWSEPPDEDEMQRVVEFCSGRDGAWTYFYRCMSDTANVLDSPGHF